MREILFRGKDVQGNWHMGLLANMGNCWYISNKAGIPTAYEVIPETIGQCTGKKIGERLIFENDIFDFGLVYADVFEYSQYTNYIGVVVWDDKRCSWSMQCDDDVYSFNDVCFSNTTYLGNIHDNSELMKGMRLND